MTWTLAPTTRSDIAVEVDELLDGSGNYTGPWLETVDIFTVRVTCRFNGGSPTVVLEEGIFTTNDSIPKVLRSNTIPISSLHGFAGVDLSCRYFRLVVSGGSADNLFQACVRVVA